MDSEERTLLYNRIISGITIIEYDGIIYFVHDPTNMDLYLASTDYDQIYKQLIANKIPTENEIHALLIEKGLWNSSKDKQIEDLKSNLKILNKQLPALEFRSDEKKQVKAYIARTEFLLNSLFKEKTYLFNQSAEYLAKIQKYRKIVFLKTFNNNGKRIWTNWNKFLKTDDHLLNKIIETAFFNSEITEKSIREIARTDPWRSIWIAASKTGNLFSTPLTQITEYQHTLLSWSIIYDGVFESMDCPDQTTIENDILLDEWFIQQHEKRENEKSKNKGADSITNNANIKNSSEIGIVVDSLEDAERVYKLNDRDAISKISSREQAVKSKGHVIEKNLPDVNQAIKLRINQVTQQNILNRSQK